MIDHVFVYGTLKTGQCRQTCWPLKPTQVCPAWTLGELVDLGAYPGLLPGNQRVFGELWSFPISGMPRILEVLDRIEGTNQGGEVNEYDRERIAVSLELGSAAGQAQKNMRAFTYIYARRDLIRNLPRMPATQSLGGQSYVSWPSHEPIRIHLEIPNIA